MRAFSLTVFAAVLATGLAAAGCGAGSRDVTSTRGAAQATVAASRTVPNHASTTPTRADREPVAKVGRTTITRGDVRHWASIEQRANGEQESSEYSALSALIQAHWVIEEASRQHVQADQQRLERESTLSGPQGEEVRETLARTGESLSDFRFVLLVKQLTARIYGRLEHLKLAFTHAQIAAYFRRNREHFALPETRDLHIIRFPGEEQAQRAKREIERGTSFATVVQHVSLAQPISARHGLLRGLTPINWPEQPLSEDIFDAPLHALRGPVQISLGYYVFEVLQRTPGRQRTLAEVAPEVTQRLRQFSREQLVARFLAELRQRWGARTACPPSRLVAYCERAKSSPATLQGSPLP